MMVPVVILYPFIKTKQLVNRQKETNEHHFTLTIFNKYVKLVQVKRFA